MEQDTAGYYPCITHPNLALFVITALGALLGDSVIFPTKTFRETVG